jgi:hypothetical protein
VCDSEGNVLISFTPEKSYQSVVFSSPDLADGTYTVTAGDMSETVEISSICTSNSTTMGMGGGGGFGGGNGGGKGGGFGGNGGNNNEDANSETDSKSDSETEA